MYEKMYEKFLYLLKVNNVSASKVADEVGISRSIFTNWKQKKSVPKLDTLQKIAKYFGVGIEYFLN
ncbi:helix-turn-helix domain-containing protein [Faecalimonas sp.]